MIYLFGQIVVSSILWLRLPCLYDYDKTWWPFVITECVYLTIPDHLADTKPHPNQGTLKIEGRTTHKFVYTRLLKFLLYSRTIQIDPCCSVQALYRWTRYFRQKWETILKLPTIFKTIYTSCAHKLTSLPWKQCFDVNFQTCDNTFQSLVYGSKDTKWSFFTEKIVLVFLAWKKLRVRKVRNLLISTLTAVTTPDSR